MEKRNNEPWYNRSPLDFFKPWQIVAFVLFLITYFAYFFYTQEKKKKVVIAKCPTYSVMFPYKHTDFIYFTYSFKGTIYDTHSTFGGEDDEFALTVSKLREERLKKRWFIYFNCNQPTVFKVMWDIPVPDTLKYIPTNGWDKIPYGLDKNKLLH